MALPTISHNSPAAGSISWTAFSIRFGNATFGIPADSTASRFVWWEYRSGAPALVAGDTLPDLAAEDILLFLNKGGMGVLVPMTDTLEGSLIVPGTVMADAISANQIQAHHIKADAVTADHLAAGSVQAEHVGAGSITAEKLSVGTVSDNYVVNGSFEDSVAGTLVGWEVNAKTDGDIYPVTGVASSGAVAMCLDATTTTANLRFRQPAAQHIPVSSASARRWYISARMGAGTATTNGAYLRIEWFDAAHAYLSFSDIIANRAMTTTFTVYEGQVTPPSTARYMGIQVLWVSPSAVSKLYVDEIVAREVVVAAHIGDGQIVAAKVAAGAITADKMAIGDFTNLAAGGSFDSTVAYSNWNAVTGGSIVTTSPKGGPYCLQVTANAAVRTMTHKDWPTVSPGDQLYYQFWAKTSTDWNGTTTASRVRFLNQAGAQISVHTFGNTASWTLYDGVVTIPAGANQLRMEIQFDHTVGTAWIDEVLVRRMSKGELIVDGAIIASKIATDAVTADKIAANAVVADKIAANAVTADKVAANAITADKIDANAINGKTITGSTLATTNGGLKWTDAGIEAKNVASGAKTFGLDAATGAVSILGGDLTTVSQSVDDGIIVQATLGTTEATDFPGQEVPALYFVPSNAATGDLHASVTTKSGGKELTLSSGVFASNPTDHSNVSVRNTGIWLRTSEVNGAISADSGYNYTRGDLQITHDSQDIYNTTTEPGATAGTYLTTKVQQYKGKVHLQGTDGIEAESAITAAAGISTGPTTGPRVASLNYQSNGTKPGTWYSMTGSLSGEEGWVGIDGNGEMTVRGRKGSPLHIRSNDATTPVRMYGWFDLYDPPTSTFTANVGISSTPKDRFYRLTSAAKYKLNVDEQTLEKAKRILNVTPKTWYDRNATEAYADYMAGADISLDDIMPMRRVPGVVAEDVEAAGLEEYVTYDADGEIEGVAYDRLPTLLIPLVRDLYEENTALRTELEEQRQLLLSLADRVKKLEDATTTTP